MKFTKKEIYNAFKDYVDTVCYSEGIFYDEVSNPIIKRIVKELKKKYKLGDEPELLKYEKE